MCTYWRTYLWYRPWFVQWIRRSVLRSIRPERENYFWKAGGAFHKHTCENTRCGMAFVFCTVLLSILKIWNCDQVPYLQYEGFVNHSLGIVLIENVFQVTKCRANGLVTGCEFNVNFWQLRFQYLIGKRRGRMIKIHVKIIVGQQENYIVTSEWPVPVLPDKANVGLRISVNHLRQQGISNALIIKYHMY